MADAVEPFSWTDNAAASNAPAESQPTRDLHPQTAPAASQPAPTLDDLANGLDIDIQPFDLTGVIDEQGEHVSAEQSASIEAVANASMHTTELDQFAMAMASTPAVDNAQTNSEATPGDFGPSDQFTAPLSAVPSTGYGDSVAFQRDPMTGTVVPERAEISESALTAAFGADHFEATPPLDQGFPHESQWPRQMIMSIPS